MLEMRFPFWSRTPWVSVRRMSFLALRDAAMRPATWSALILYVSPSSPTPQGNHRNELTCNEVLKKIVIDTGHFPYHSDVDDFRSLIIRFLRTYFIFLAVMRFPSLPDSPTD